VNSDGNGGGGNMKIEPIGYAMGAKRFRGALTHAFIADAFAARL
jgi:hypothetical protein